MESNSNSAPVQSSETNPNVNSNQASEPSSAQQEAQTPTITPEAVAEYLGTTPEGLESFTKFSKANGGLDKAFGKMKQTISNPQPQQPTGPQASTQPNLVLGGPVNADGTTNDVYIPQQQQNQKPAEGYLSANDIAKLQYNKMLSEAYSELDTEGYITKGEFVKEATSMGIPVMDQAGNMNDAAIRKFLDLKKATIPPTPASAPITSTPTVEYQTIEGEITATEQAHKIMQQGEGHPQYNQAVKFLKESIFGKAPEKK